MMCDIINKVTKKLTSGSEFSKRSSGHMQQLKSYSCGVPEVPRSRIKFLKQLGIGSFAKTYKGLLLAESPDELPVTVAVRELKENMPNSVRSDFLEELQFLADLHHPNIMCLLGVITESEPISMLFEVSSQGCLPRFLMSHSPKSQESRSNGEADDFLRIDELYLIASQVAAGMEYLASRCYVYNALMASNCYVGENLLVKIYEAEIKCNRMYVAEDLLEIRWMPPEMLSKPHITLEVNVWNFGVVLWEIFSYGTKPYQGLSSQEVVEKVKSLQLLECPDGCPAHAYDLMLKCWQGNPDKRPSFRNLHGWLKSWEGFPDS
ncbi:tyrosine-protein kinase transmembrane receptor Ror-like isoform X2 [Macrobrachium nipponense]|uniref:tyrosine-protein kinase transmembrane receptor Ror-like isoform X2 n=1 Tax=Macrobrachium nipponense TaxID=159736 RepID=UPI0030C7B9A6